MGGRAGVLAAVAAAVLWVAPAALAAGQFNNQDEVVGVGQATNAPVIPGVTRTVTRTQISGTTFSTDFPAFPTGQPPDGFSALKSMRLSGQPNVLNGKAVLRTPPTC